jgi:hypothetical protein
MAGDEVNKSWKALVKKIEKFGEDSVLNSITGVLGHFVDLLKSVVMRWLDLVGWWVKPLTGKSPSEWLATGADKGKKELDEATKS